MKQWSLESVVYTHNYELIKYESPNHHDIFVNWICNEFNKKIDVIYIDSVLTMLENPLIILDKLMNSCEYIFINRTDLGFTDTIKTSSQWGGMDKNSTLWQFSSKTIIDFVDKNNCSLKELQNGVFVIKSNKKK